MKDSKGIEIYDLIKLIHKELRKVRKDSEIVNDPMLVLADVEIELSVMVSKIGKASLKLVVLTLGGAYEKEKAHKIKLKFETLAHPAAVRTTTQEKGIPVLGFPISVEDLRELAGGQTKAKKKR